MRLRIAYGLVNRLFHIGVVSFYNEPVGESFQCSEPRAWGGVMILIDTCYLVALINRKDALNAQAKTLAQGWDKSGQHLVTTDAVLIEFSNFFARSPLRALASSWQRRLRRRLGGWTIERLTPQLMECAEARYAAHPDKTWSLTDCLSMEVMLDYSATQAATADRHFGQAGFRVLLATSP